MVMHEIELRVMQ